MNPAFACLASMQAETKQSFRAAGTQFEKLISVTFGRQTARGIVKTDVPSRSCWLKLRLRNTTAPVSS